MPGRVAGRLRGRFSRIVGLGIGRQVRCCERGIGRGITALAPLAEAEGRSIEPGLAEFGAQAVDVAAQKVQRLGPLDADIDLNPVGGEVSSNLTRPSSTGSNSSSTRSSLSARDAAWTRLAGRWRGRPWMSCKPVGEARSDAGATASGTCSGSGLPGSGAGMAGGAGIGAVASKGNGASFCPSPTGEETRGFVQGVSLEKTGAGTLSETVRASS